MHVVFGQGGQLKKGSCTLRLARRGRPLGFKCFVSAQPRQNTRNLGTKELNRMGGALREGARGRCLSRCWRSVVTRSQRKVLSRKSSRTWTVGKQSFQCCRGLHVEAGGLLRAREWYGRAPHDQDKCHKENPSQTAERPAEQGYDQGTSLCDCQYAVPAIRPTWQNLSLPCPHLWPGTCRA